MGGTAAAGTVFLMYHELEVAGRELCEREEGYARYVVTAEHFQEHLTRMGANGWRGLSVTEALAGGADEEAGVCLTFDDGCETDLTVAAPSLLERGFGATFYVTWAHVGRRGYLSAAQLRELADLGLEVGSHSLTHSYLDDLPPERLRAEIAESKERLEQLTGRRVPHFSCPGGRTNALVTELARAAGYESVATSRVGVNPPGSDRFGLARVAVMRGTTGEHFERLCRAEGFGLRRVTGAVLTAAKRVLGNAVYEKVRATALGRR